MAEGGATRTWTIRFVDEGSTEQDEVSVSEDLARSLAAAAQVNDALHERFQVDFHALFASLTFASGDLASWATRLAADEGVDLTASMPKKMGELHRIKAPDLGRIERPLIRTRSVRQALLEAQTINRAVHAGDAREPLDAVSVLAAMLAMPGYHERDFKEMGVVRDRWRTSLATFASSRHAEQATYWQTYGAGAGASDTRPATPQPARPSPPGAPLSTLEEIPLTGRARKVVTLAVRIAGQEELSSVVGTRSLLTATLREGRPERTDSAADWLVKQLPKDVSVRWRARFLGGRQGDAVRVDRISDELRDVLGAASVLALETKGTGFQVNLRHVLAAMLAPETLGEPASASSALQELGVDVTALRSALGAAVQEWSLRDARGPWQKLAIASPSPAAAAPAPGAVARTSSGPRIADYTDDRPEGEDRLGIEREVWALASLAAAWHVVPPLSIGLFGEWGTGKTFFMRKMQEQVRKLARSAREAKKPQKTFGYCKNVVQVEFNAWHYVEGNLWACLVEQILHSLKVDEKEDETVVEARRKKLLREIANVEGAGSRAEKAAREKRDDADKATTDAANARRDVEDVRAGAVDLAKVVAGALGAELKSLLGSLDVGEKGKQTLENLRGALEESRTVWGRLGMLTRRLGPWRAAGAALLVIGALGFGSPMRAHNRRSAEWWASSPPSSSRSVLSSRGSWLGFAR